MFRTHSKHPAPAPGDYERRYASRRHVAARRDSKGPEHQKSLKKMRGDLSRLADELKPRSEKNDSLRVSIHVQKEEAIEKLARKIATRPSGRTKLCTLEAFATLAPRAKKPKRERFEMGPHPVRCDESLEETTGFEPSGVHRHSAARVRSRSRCGCREDQASRKDRSAGRVVDIISYSRRSLHPSQKKPVHSAPRYFFDYREDIILMDDVLTPENHRPRWMVFARERPARVHCCLD